VKRNSHLFCIVMALLGILPLQAQSMARIVVIPFNPINVSLQEAELVLASFETTLLQTKAYSIVGREELTGLLESMGLGLFDCTSEECAAAIAVAASAGQLVRGDLARHEGSLVLKIKLVEVSSGRALYLDTLTAPSLDQMRQSMELFVFKLAGLTVISGKEEKIAREFGEVFLETVPARAEIFINGVRKGVSPDLIRRVPIGRVRITAQSGTLCGEKTVETVKSLQQVRIELLDKPGSLQLSAKENLDVYLDGNRLGPLGSGNYAGLVPGIHTVELRSEGLYWRDDVVIRAGVRTIAVAEPRPYGTIAFEIPTAAVAEIRGELDRKVVSGKGAMPLPAGEYIATITGSDYEKLEGLRLSVAKGSTTLLRPDLQLSRSYELEQFNSRVAEAARTIEYGYRLTSGDILKLQILRQAISQSRHGFPELVSRVDSLIQRAEIIVAAKTPAATPAAGEAERVEKTRRLNELLAQKQQWELQLESRRLERRRKIPGGWASFGVGLATGGLSVLFRYLSDQAYRNYEEATTWEEAQRRKDEVKLWDISTIAALGTSGVCLVISSVLWLSSPPTRPIRREIESIQKEIALLDGAPTGR